MKTTRTQDLMAVALVCALAATTAQAQSAKPKMATDIPAEITTPNSVETRIGTLKFFDGYPDADTVTKVYDNLDFLRGVEVFLNAMPGASLVAIRHGFRDVGAVDGTIGIFETLMDSKSLFLTPNTETVYAVTWLDLKKGPLVVESPPNTLGIVDDFWFNYVTDLGNAGPDKGKGGKFLFPPPGYKGDVPKDYFVFSSPTFGNVMFWRGFLVNGDPKPAVENIKKHARIYALAEEAHPSEQKFVNLSGREFNTIHANDFHFYQEVDEILQEEPNEAQNPEILGLLASIDLEKGKRFAPDERMKKTLSEAAAVGNATARANLFTMRDKDFYLYPNSQWKTLFPGGSHEFLQNGVRRLDARTAFFYYATGITPAMTAKRVVMIPKRWMQRMAWTSLFLVCMFAAGQVEAQRFAGRGGGGGGARGGGGGGSFSRGGVASSGSFGGTRSAGSVSGSGTARSYSGSGAASSGTWQGGAASQASRQTTAQQMQSKNLTANAASQTSRQNTAKEMQARQQAGDAANREDWQSHANTAREDRQDYRTNSREDWQEYGDDHYYHGGSYWGHYPAYPAGGVAAGMVIGATMTAAAFNAQKTSCSTLVINRMSYYQCGSTWYQPAYQGGNVTYIVVNPPK